MYILQHSFIAFCVSSFNKDHFLVMKSLFLVCIFPLLILANPKVRLPDLLNDVVAVDPPEIKPLGQWFLTLCNKLLQSTMWPKSQKSINAVVSRTNFVIVIGTYPSRFQIANQEKNISHLFTKYLKIRPKYETYFIKAACAIDIRSQFYREKFAS